MMIIALAQRYKGRMEILYVPGVLLIKNSGAIYAIEY